MDSADPAGFPCHPPSDGASQWFQHDAERPDTHPPGSAWSGSDASDRTDLAIQCGWSLDHPQSDNPSPAIAQARRRQLEAVDSTAGAMDFPFSGSDATAQK